MAVYHGYTNLGDYVFKLEAPIPGKRLGSSGGYSMGKTDSRDLAIEKMEGVQESHSVEIADINKRLDRLEGSSNAAFHGQASLYDRMVALEKRISELEKDRLKLAESINNYLSRLLPIT